MKNGVGKKKIVLTSVLNWNTAKTTAKCVQELLALNVPENYSHQIIVIDNGSSVSDVNLLQQLLAPLVGDNLSVHQEPQNLGFAGGTNVGIKHAATVEAEFVWLVNSDACIDNADTLELLVAEMEADQKCGAISPQLKLLSPPFNPYFSGAIHDWNQRLSIRLDESRSRTEAKNRIQDMWVPGTALLLRSSAIAQVGGLDERFFAYYEDDEICTRLARHGWTSRICYGASIKHAMPKRETDRPPYYFYLIQRNHLLFWFENSPRTNRVVLFLKLIEQALFDVNKLRLKGFDALADASTLGLSDFLFRRFGAPNLDRAPPFTVRLIIALSKGWQRGALAEHLKEYNSR